MRMKYLYIFYFKNISKGRLYLAASSSFLLFLSIRILMHVNTWFDKEDYGNLLAEIILVVQMISVLYMIYFYLTFSTELKYGIHNFFVDGYKILVEKIAALIFVHISFQAILLSIVYMIFFMFYLFFGVEWSSIYGSLFRYLIDYMFFPLLFSALIGIITALIFGVKKISIIFILLIWFFTGGINQEVFAYFFEKVQSTDWETLLSIGPNSMYSVYRSYMGFNTSVGLELRLLTWLLLLLFLILFVSMKWAVIKRERNRMRRIALVLLFVAIGTSYLSIKYNTSTFNIADHSKELEYYEQIQGVKTDLNYDISTYRITMKGKGITSEIKFKDTNTDKPSFQLYHSYPIHHITVDGEDASYSREGDIVHIESPTDSFKKIVFRYELVDTGLIYSENNRNILLANQAWYPKKRDEHMYKPNNMGYIDIVDSPFDITESYHFELFAEDILFTNLTNVGTHYKGITNGLSIIRGQGNQLNYKGHEITYPADWPDMSKRIEEVTNVFEATMEELQKVAVSNVNNLPDKWVFTTDMTPGFIDDNHLIYNVGGITVSITNPEVVNNFIETLMNMTIEPKGNNKMFEEWSNLTSLMIKKEYDLPIFMDNPITEMHESSFEIINRIYYEFKLMNVVEKRRFLNQWYSEVNENWTWGDVEELIEERIDQ